jgi:hypothetical protein
MNTINKFKQLFVLAAVASMAFSATAFAAIPFIPVDYNQKIEVPGGYVQGGKFFPYPPTPPSVSEEDIISGFQKDLELKLIAPTDIQPIPNTNFNLSGVMTQVNALERTVLVNNLDPNSSPRQQAGAIAVTNTNERTIASNGLVPVGAARNVNENNEFNVMGAAYKVDAADTDVDFVISQPILK